jgi:cytochrome c oxidase cbb3-type subunit III
MRHLTLLLAGASVYLSAQEPPGGGDSIAATAAAITGSKENPAAVDRGGKLFLANCAGCHGATAKGGAGAPDLIRSLLVLDDEKGILISPVLREGRPDKGMPRSNLTEPQIADIVAWLHVQRYAAGHRTTYAFLNVVTGDPKKGEAYFQTTGKCSECHSVTGDLAGIGKKYEPLALQTRWLQPRGPARGAPPAVSRSVTTVKVTLASGQTFSGVLDRIDDFNVSLRDSAGEYRSFSRDGETPKIEINNPLKAHTDLVAKYTDADIHNVTAYLVTLR